MTAFIECGVCGKLSPANEYDCPRCGAPLDTPGVVVYREEEGPDVDFDPDSLAAWKEKTR